MAKTILLVEDTSDDVFFATRAFKKAGLVSRIALAEDGQQAIDYLTGKGEFGDRTQHPLPSVILLDIKMPFLSGFEVLRWIRSESNFPTVPVLMLTSSDQESDIEKAYALGANAYLVKPPHGDDFLRLAQLIKGFWMDANVPPNPGNSVRQDTDQQFDSETAHPL